MHHTEVILHEAEARLPFAAALSRVRRVIDLIFLATLCRESPNTLFVRSSRDLQGIHLEYPKPQRRV